MVDCEISPTYPCGLVISPKEKEMSIERIDMKKARGLAELNSPLIFRGFQNATDIDLFTLKAKEMGPVMPWKFGEVLVVRDAGAENGGLNNVLSSEPMPMHFDGLFKTTVMKGEDGTERLVPQPPRYIT
jgi:alpha-ketoglutarate-dependent taurine dioxygenase